jgi:peptidoglycan/xylan/chitin deacetylase (PgdA/CDA1 family)
MKIIVLAARAVLVVALIIPAIVSADLGANLFTNGSFESNSSGWVVQPDSGNSTSFTYPVAGNNGSKALGIKVTSYSRGDIFWQPAKIPVSAGKQYFFSAYSLNSVPVAVIASFYNSSGSAVAYATLGTVPAGASWRQFSATTTVPAGATTMRVQHVIRAVGTLAVDDYSLSLYTPSSSTTTPPVTPPATTTKPVINSFAASPTTVTAGQSSTLSWATSGATFMTIDQGVGAVTGTSKVVSPNATTTYTLSAGNSAGTTTATVVVNVKPVVVTPPPPPAKPIITSFSASPTTVTAGQSSTLSWVTSGATLLVIDNGVGTVTGTSKSVAPSATTTYMLSAGNSAGTTTATVVVNVKPVVVTPPPPSNNLIANGNLESGSTNAPTGWSNDFWGSMTPKFTYPVAGKGGGKAAQIQVTQFTDGAANWIFNHVTASTHAQYQFTEDYMATVPTELDIEYKMSDGTFRYEWLQTVVPSASWQTVTAQVTPPTGAVSFTVLHILAKVGMLTIDNASLATLNDPFAQGMITFAFDDGLTSQYQNAVPMLNAAGFKASFYIITNQPTSGDSNSMTWTQIKNLASQGFEIGGHTRTHAALTTLNAAQLSSEVSGSYQDLAAQGLTPTSFVYPLGDVNATVEAAVKNAGYQVARGSYYGLNGTVSDRYNLYDIRIDASSNLNTIKQYIDQAKADKRWIVLEIHDVMTGGDEFAVTPAFFQSLVSYIKTSGVQVSTLSQGMSGLNN